MFVILILVLVSTVANVKANHNNRLRKLQNNNGNNNNWKPRRTDDNGGLCIYEPDCNNFFGGCEQGTFCNVSMLPGGYVHSLCLENPGHEGKNYNCYSIRNSNGANNRIGCITDGDCCNPAAKCGLDRYCHLECDLPDPPTSSPTAPTDSPTTIPTTPTEIPTETPSTIPTTLPTEVPSTEVPSAMPTVGAEAVPTADNDVILYDPNDPVSSPVSSPNSAPNTAPSTTTDPSVPTDPFHFVARIIFSQTTSTQFTYNQAVQFSRTFAEEFDLLAGSVGSRKIGEAMTGEDGTYQYIVEVLIHAKNSAVPDPYKEDYAGLTEKIETYLESEEFPHTTPIDYRKNLDKAGMDDELLVKMEYINTSPTAKPSLSSAGSTSEDSASSTSSSSDNNAGAIAGGVFAALFAVAVMFGAYYYYTRGVEEQPKEGVDVTPSGASNPTSFDNVDIVVSNGGIPAAPSVGASP